MRKLLWIGDAGCPSGFARATHETLEVLRHTWDVSVLALNYHGDPHKFPYPMYPCMPGGDALGIGRVDKLVSKLRPDLVVVQNDPWLVPLYLRRINDDHSGTPVVASIPVDGKNCRGGGLNGLALAIFWTEFGRREAAAGGYLGASTVIPLGVDLEEFYPGSKEEARERVLRLPPQACEGFIVGNVNRNQQRKRLDLTVSFFCEWVKDYDVRDAFLYLHVAPTGDQNGYDVAQLMRYYGLSNRLIQPKLGVRDVAASDRLRATYQAFDVQVSTTQGEGWGLCTAEGMACGVPQIVPKWAALEEWCGSDAVALVSCSEIAATVGHMSNALGGVPDRGNFIEWLHTLYSSPNLRAALGSRGLARVSEDRFRWKNIGQQFAEALDALALAPVMVRTGSDG